MTDRPWWLDPRRLPPRMEATRAEVFAPGHVRALRIVIVVSLIGSVVLIAMGYVSVGVVIGTSFLVQSLLWSADQRKQVFTRS